MSHPATRKARIYRPAKSVQQSGRRKTKEWIVEFEPEARKEADNLIGWVGSDDTQQQVKMRFGNKQAAINYCERYGLDYSISLPRERAVKPKAYADNFTRPVLD